MKKFFAIFRMMMLGALVLPMVSCEKEIDIELSCPDEGRHKHAVDLGLSVKWACCNVGAYSPEEFGGYYAWGELKEKETYEWKTYSWASLDNNNSYETVKYNNDEWSDYYDGKIILSSTDDVARREWGIGWRMPTVEEFNELFSRCQWSVVEYNGVECQMATGPNGNSILFPYCGSQDGDYTNYEGPWGYGWYWTANCCDYGSSKAYSVQLKNKSKSTSKDPSYPDNYLMESPRFYGMSVRAVRD